MNRSPGILIAEVLVLITIAACATPLQTSTPVSSAEPILQAEGSPNSVNYLIDVEGAVELKRQGWTDYVPVAFGTCLRWGDLVRVSDSASAAIACADLSIQPLTDSYFGGLPCPQAVPVLVREKAPIISPRGGALIPYPLVLSPRATALVDPYPLLRWSPLSGVVTHTVTVRGSGLNWQTQTLQTEVRYPADAPSLQPGGDGCVLVVEASGHSSDEEGGVFRGFTLLDDDVVRQVREHEQRIALLNISDAARRYLTAQMHASQGIRADAIIALEALAPEANTPAVWNALANQYLAVGLFGQAADTYATASVLAKSTSDRLSQAQAELGCAQAYRGLNDPATALSHAQQALGLFQSLGDSEGMAQSEKLKKELGNP